MSDRDVSYTHLALVGERPPRARCGGAGRADDGLTMRIADVDCPDCLQLEADRQTRVAESEVSSAVPGDEVEPLMMMREVAAAFRVGEKQPMRWAKSGLITCVRTPGGRPRFKRAEIEGLLRRGNSTPPFLKAAK